MYKTGRQRSLVWQFVKRREGNKWRCPYCKTKRGTGVARLEAHLLGEKGRGSAICGMVPKEVQDQVARLSRKRDNNVTTNSSDLQGDPNKVNPGESACVEEEVGMRTSSVRDDDTMPHNNIEAPVLATGVCQIFDDSTISSGLAVDHPTPGCMRLDQYPRKPNAPVFAVDHPTPGCVRPDQNPCNPNAPISTAIMGDL